MRKNNYSTIVDFGSSELRLGVFDNNLSKIFFYSKSISQKNNYEEYSKLINFLIKEAENKISSHLENITVLYDTSEICTIDLSIKKKLDQKIIFSDVCSSIILEANQIIKNYYIDKKVVHLMIKKYIINDKEFLNIPEEIPELNSVILEIKFICLPYDEYKKVFETFKKNNLKIINFFLSSLVKSFQYINLFKKNKLVAFLDIGLDRTSIIYFQNQKLDCLNSIPIGGSHISKDISQILKLSLEESEELKKAANFLDERLSEVKEASGLDEKRAAIITALNISNEYLKNLSDVGKDKSVNEGLENLTLEVQKQLKSLSFKA